MALLQVIKEPCNWRSYERFFFLAFKTSAYAKIIFATPPKIAGNAIIKASNSSITSAILSE
ncbi:hypothetical protein BSQ39_05480 [Loigolactobacillus backii]|nr:hypothetical protein AYR52_02015 [Loigolactobacillus backii]ANK64137.1 hypothetical protein AYR54_02005 [Loigolactobacillus backii]ANK67469.1 hypothetical protein AYR55_07035 [Loigolactobacillus backii]OLF69622.1 hypothetical protein ACX53_06855 [Loigolactobacillus backii]PIO83064.1 hypothetical protein BSQ39_05480 [Loigolactobacillus backii]